MRYSTKWLVFLGIVFLFVMIGGFFVTDAALAQDFGTGYLGGLNLPADDLRTIVVRIINITLGVIGIIFLLFILYGGFLWMTARGNQQQVSKAQKIIINATTGLIIIFMAFAITMLIFNFLGGAGGGGSGPCEENLVQGCYRCESGIWVRHPEWLGCGLPGSEFRINDIQTSHGGTNDSEDVYLCSSVQALTNNVINGLTVPGNVYLTLDSAPVPPVEITLAAGSKWMEMIPDALLVADSLYTAHYSKDITDMSLPPLPLSVCQEPLCSDAGTEFVWTFHTGFTVDDVPPEITQTSPIFEGGNYPDRNVDRDKKIVVKFNEAVRFSTIEDTSDPPHPIAANIWVERLESQGTSFVPPVIIPATDYTVEQILDGSYGFVLIYDDLDYYDPFTWYRVTVQNIEDLCGNAMEDPLIWEFQTNANVPGIGSWYPTGSNICPDVGLVTLSFNTSMYYDNVAIEIDDDGAWPPYIEVMLPSGETEIEVAGVGWWRVDPLSDYKVFTFTFADSLQVNTHYDVAVTTNRVMDNEGNTLGHSWWFEVTNPESCTCSPYISHMSPIQGLLGECVTIYGQCFNGAVPHDDTDPRYAELSTLIFESDDTPPVTVVVDPNDYDNGPTYIVTAIPDSFVLGNRLYPQATIEYIHEPTLGSLSTNNTNVNFFVESNGLSQGPCLFSVNPNQACHGDPLQLNGIRLGDDPGPGNRAVLGVDNVTFHFLNPFPPPPLTSLLADNPEPSSWSDTRIDVQVPLLTDDGNIVVTSNLNQSNPLPFEIACPVGERCSSVFPGCSPNQSQCSEELECDENCYCSEPDGPKVIGHGPDCVGACRNALIWARFSESMDATSLIDANIDVKPCNDLIGECNWNNLGLEIDYEDPNGITYDDALKQVNINPDNDLDANQWYRVILYDEINHPNGIKNSDGQYLVGLNFDSDGNGSNDTYSWTFETGGEICDIDTVSLAPETAHANTLHQTIPYNSYAQAETQECGNQLLDPYDYDWSWGSNNDLIATITNNTGPDPPGYVLPVQVARAEGEEGTAVITASTIENEIIFSATGDLIVNFSHQYPEVFYWDPTCEVSCTNVQIWAKFTESMEAGSLDNDSIDVRPCANENCLLGGLGPEINYLPDPRGFTYDDSEFRVNIAPDGELAGLRWYRVIFHEGILGSSGEPLAGLNFDSSDDGINVDDSFSWTFGTRHDACEIDSVRVSPAWFEATELWQPVNYNAYAEAEVLVCGNQTLDPYNYNWIWDSSIPAIAEITNNQSLLPPFYVLPVQEARVLSDPDNPSTTNIEATAETILGSGVLNVNFITCEDSMDCLACPGSFCDESTYTCMPVIETIDPEEGPIGRWVTLRGCYFGAAQGSGYVNFGDTIAAEPACDYSWQNDQILIEVPEDAVSGSQEVSVLTGRGLSSNPVRFNVINECLRRVPVPPGGVPGLCSLIPMRGAINSNVDLLGTHFGDSSLRPGKNVTFERVPPGRTEALITGWTDTLIDAIVPADAYDGDVIVEVDFCPSNPLPYDVSIGLGTACSSDPNICVPDDPQCGQNTQLYCHRDSCTCQRAPAPNVISVEPGGNDVCRNAVFEITFDQVMNRNSVRSNIDLKYTDPSGACELGFNQEYEESSSLKRIVKAWFDKLAEIIFGKPQTAYGQLEYNCDWDIASIQVYDVDDEGGDYSVALVTPSGDLARETEYMVTVRTGVKNVYGVNMDDLYQHYFTTRLDVCEIGSLDITVWPPGVVKSSDTFYCAGDTCPDPDDVNNSFEGNQHQYKADARDKSGTLLNVDYNWIKVDHEGAFTLCINDDCTVIDDNVSDVFLTNSVNDGARATVIVGAHDDGNSSVGAATSTLLVRNDLCEVPWPARSATTPPFIDTDTDFSFWYCRAKNENYQCFDNVEQKFTGTNCTVDPTVCDPADTCKLVGLPALNVVETPMVFQSETDEDTTAPLLKEFLFLLPAPSADAIALRVHGNFEMLSPVQWYRRYVPNQGSPQSMEVNGYQAVRDGRTVYVSAATETVPDSDIYTTQMFLLSYNRNAGPDAVAIYNALLANWEFTLDPDLVDYNICDDDTIYCTEDQTCEDAVPSLGLCRINATKIRRDTKRVTDLGEIYSLALKYYGVCSNDPDRGCTVDDDCPGNCNIIHGEFPSLPAATYVAGMSTSRWPSWSRTLTPVLGVPSLPVDPFNTFKNCPAGYDPIACWDDTNKQFQCPAGSHIYQYITTNDGLSFDLYANFELHGISWAWNKIISVPSSDWCDDIIINATGGGEACEDGTTRICGTSVGVCETGLRTCTGGSWGPCEGGVWPVLEICGNGLDDDCDGAIDEFCDPD